MKVTGSVSSRTASAKLRRLIQLILSLKKSFHFQNDFFAFVEFDAIF